MDYKIITPAEWKELSAEEKRVAIARDVIASLNKHRYNARQGTYVDEETFNDYPLNTSVQKILEVNNPPECTVCALGGCFLSLIKFNNNVTVEEILDMDFTSAGVMRKQLGEFFSEEQLGLIETAFENDIDYARRVDADDLQAHKAADFFEIVHDVDGYYDETKLMIAIMQNIIDNNGTFVP